MSYRCVVEDDITARHVTVKNVLLQVLNERSLQGRRGRVRWTFRFRFAHFNLLCSNQNAHGQTPYEAKKLSDIFLFYVCVIILPQYSIFFKILGINSVAQKGLSAFGVQNPAGLNSRRLLARGVLV